MFFAPCQGCHSLQELRKKLICVVEKELLDSPGMATKNRQPQTQMQSLPVANFSGRAYFSRGGRTEPQTRMLGAAWIAKSRLSQGQEWVPGVDHLELESSRPSLARRCCRVWADGWRMGKLPHAATVWFFTEARDMDLKWELYYFSIGSQEQKKSKNNSMGERKVQSSGSQHLTGERCWMRRGVGTSLTAPGDDGNTSVDPYWFLFTSL